MLLICCIFASSCSRERGDIQSGDIDFKTYSIDVSDSLNLLFEAVDSLDIIWLNYDENLDQIRHVLIHKGFLLAVDLPNQQLLVFDENGNLVWKIDKEGAGNDEYSILWNVWIDKNIRVFDSTNGLIQDYDINGAHLTTEVLDYVAGSAYSRSGMLVLDLGHKLIDGKYKYQILHIDEAEGTAMMSIPYRRSRPIDYSWEMNEFSEQGTALLYHNSIDDTVYVLRGNRFQPMMSFDFGNDWLWRDTVIYSDKAIAMENMRTAGKVWSLSTIVGEKSIYLSLMPSNQEVSILIDRVTGNTINLSLKKSTGDYYKLFPLFWENDRILFSLRKEEINEFISEAKQNNIDLRMNGEKESSQQSALVWMKFKNSTNW